MLSEKYRPTTLKDVIGQDNVMPEIVGWAKSWENNRPAYKSMLLYGPPGVGKTSTAHAIANDFHWDILEMNASDSSKPSDLKELIGNAIYTPSVSGKVLILIDESDALGKKGFEVLEQLIEDSVNPIVLTCNDEYAIKKVTSYFRDSSLMIKFSSIKEWKLVPYIKNIAEKEGIDAKLVEELVRNSQGDLRYILNNIGTLEIVPRTNMQNIFGIVHDIFAGSWDGDTRGTDISEIWFCMKQNITGFYDTILEMDVAEFSELVDMRFHRLQTLLSAGDSRAAFSQWKYIVQMWKMMPPHQKSQKIELKSMKQPIDYEIKAMARDLHMSYKKASSKLDNTYLMLNIWKKWKASQQPIPKPKPVVQSKEVKPIQTLSQKSTRDLFDFAESRSTAA
ncbi:MAG: AAA family ATPase [Bacillati bacterium]